MTTTTSGPDRGGHPRRPLLEGVPRAHPCLGHRAWVTSAGTTAWDDPTEAGRARDLAALDELERDIAAARVAGPADGGPDRPSTSCVWSPTPGARRTRPRALADGQPRPDGGPQTLPTELARFQRIDTPERLERLLARLEAYPALLEAHAAEHRGRHPVASAPRRAWGGADHRPDPAHGRGAHRGIAPPRGASRAVAGGPASGSAAAIERWVQPALGASWAARGLPAARPRRVRACAGCRMARRSTATPSSPPRRLPETAPRRSTTTAWRASRSWIGSGMPSRASWAIADSAAYRAFLETDPANSRHDPAEIVRIAEAQVASAFDAAPALVRAAADAPLRGDAGRAAPGAGRAAGVLLPAREDGSRPGRYYINTYQPESRPLHRLAATTFHEATPGHHFQIALEAELPGLNRFRRLGSRLAGMAYAEGWGLYAERPRGRDGPVRGRPGALRDASTPRRGGPRAWWSTRACTPSAGPASRASTCCARRRALSQLEAETETDRYIALARPGARLHDRPARDRGACARSSSERDGDRFDLRAFHDQVIGHGSLPLATLRDELPRLGASDRRVSPPRRVVIVGGGAAGTLVAIHLAAARPGRAEVIGRRARRERLGVGVAYGTTLPVAPAQRACQRHERVPGPPTHFTEWARGTGARAGRDRVPAPDALRPVPARDARRVGQAPACVISGRAAPV